MTGRTDSPGFQGSETTSAEVRFYPQRGDPVTYEAQPFQPDGQHRYDENPSLISVSTQKMLGAPSGNWSVTMKPGRRGLGGLLFRQVGDDDWVDIIFKRHSRSWHVMRGLVDNVQKSEIVGGSGATASAYTVTGRDFGKIFEVTPIWFNPYTSEDISGAVSQRVFSGAEGVFGNPEDAVRGFLRGMLAELGDVGRANWILPKEMPATSEKFVDALFVDTRDYTNEFDSVGISQSWLMPRGKLWQLAKEWSDPIFNELFVDLWRIGDGFNDLNQDEELGINESQPVLFFRDRPFPNLEQGRESPYFKLPLLVVPRQDIGEENVGKSGAERFNAFFASPQLVTEVLGEGGLELNAPLWSSEDIRRHGLRRFDVVTKYTSRLAENLLGMARQMRERARDWYCINPYLLSGTLSLRRGLPEAKVGCRLRVPGRQSELEDETYYVESVAHSWQFGTGIRTNLGVTRGWIGTDDSYLDTLQMLALEYSEAPRAQPETGV